MVARAIKVQGSIAGWLSFLILFAVLLCFWPVFGNGFVNWDDKAVLLENHNYRGLTFTHFTWMFSSFHAGHYHPLTWISFAIDYSIWGMNPLGYHLTNVVLHALNAVVFFYLLQALLQRGRENLLGNKLRVNQICCAVGALFFALHPLRVESVAWATERRDVLSGLFYILTIFAYIKMQANGGASTLRKKWYLLSIFAFILSLLSKAWGITLPLVLLVMDVYPLRRISLRDGAIVLRQKVCREKAPYILLAAIFACLGFMAQYQTAMHMVVDHGLVDRLMQAAYGLCFYPIKTLLPLNLSPLYLLEHSFNPAAPKFFGSAFAAVGVSVALAMLWRRLPWAICAWICYGIIVSPVLGLTQSGEQIAADRYSYLACLPFAVLASTGLLRIWKIDATGGHFKHLGKWVAICSAIILGGVSSLTYKQIGIWKDTISLWNRAIEVEPANYVAFNNRGNARFELGDAKDALSDFDRAISLDPAYAKSYYNRSNVRKSLGDRNAALADADKAVELHPTYFQAYNNRGTLRRSLGDAKGALSDFSEAIRLNPRYAIAHANRGGLLAEMGALPKALVDLNEAISLQPEYAQAYFNRAILYFEQDQFEQSISDFDKVIRLQPSHVEAYFQRGVLRRKNGDVEGALVDYNKAIELNPLHLDAYVKRGGLRGNLGDLEGVIEDYSKAIEIAPQNWPPRKQLENYIIQARQLLWNQK